MSKPTNGIAVDGGTTGNPGPCEYQGVHIETGTHLFEKKVGLGTNNIAEFIAIVHALGYCKKNNITDLDIYSDSQTALAWTKKGKCNTTFKGSEEVQKIIKRAEKFLQENPGLRTKPKKWITREWGEIPADYGRKN